MLELLARTPKKLTPKPVVANQINGIEEYVKVAEKVGVGVPHMAMERFKAVLTVLDYPIYNTKEVIRYMDKKCELEGHFEKKSTDNGWCWKPLRIKDRNIATGMNSFGKKGNAHRVERFGRENKVVYAPASNYFNPDLSVYSHIIPLHALKKIEAIEEAYKEPVIFVVSDYAPKPHYDPDPFLMAIIRDKSNAWTPPGLFVIDFWDEPGFGIEQMLK